MTQARLNHIALLNCHPEYLAQIDIDKIMNEFIMKTAQSAATRSQHFLNHCRSCYLLYVDVVEN